MPLIAQLVLGLLGDAVFDTRAGRLRAYEAEIDRYFDERGFRHALPTPPPPAK
jgi:hypothetical protein